MMPSRAKTRYYAVARGLKPGVYYSWEDAEKQVSGYPQARHKSFKTLQEAKDFLEMNGVCWLSAPVQILTSMDPNC